MSRGPGRVQRAVLAELDEYGFTIAWSVAMRVRQDQHGCNSDGEGNDWCRTCSSRKLSRSEQVAARRAIHAVAAAGEYVLCRGHHGGGHGEEGSPPSLTVAKLGTFAAWQRIAAENKAKTRRLAAEMGLPL